MKHEPRKVQIDYLGAALIAASVSCILLGTTWGGNEHAWDSPTILGLFGGGAVLFVLFVLQELRAPEPIMPMDLFNNRVFSIGNGITLMTGMTMFGATAFLPIYMQVVKGVSATSSGLHMLPMSFGAVTMSFFSGRMITSTGRYRIYPIAGTALLTAGMFLMLRIDETRIPPNLYSAGDDRHGHGADDAGRRPGDSERSRPQGPGRCDRVDGLLPLDGRRLRVAIFGAVLTNRLNYYLPRFLTPEELNSVDASQLAVGPRGAAKPAGRDQRRRRRSLCQLHPGDLPLCGAACPRLFHPRLYCCRSCR